MTREKFSWRKRLKSFKYAYNGFIVLVLTQHNAWLHLLATAFVTILGFYFKINRFEWALLTLAIVFVLMAEALNTAFEFLADVASPEFHPLVEKAKDVAAGAVLIAAIGSLAIGFLVFGPHFFPSLSPHPRALIR